MNQPKRRLGLSLTCVLIGCVVLGIVASALHRSSLSGTVSPLSPASQQISKAIPRLVNASSGEGSPSPQQSRQVNLTNLPVAFEPNLGQTDPQVKYLARGNGYTLFLTPSEAVLTLAPEKTQATKQKSSNRFARFAKSPMMSRNSPAAGTVGAVIRMRVAGGNPHTQIAGTENLPGISNYFVGKNPGNWRTNVPHYARVGYRDIYPGVNLAFHGAQQQLEFDFVIAPEADPAPIGLQFSGAKRIVTDTAGNLILASSAGDLRLHKPVAYQEYQGARRLVDARFVVEGKRVGFVLGNYDRSRELVIDPTLSYSTYLGGTSDDRGQGIAVDGSGNAYVTGEAGNTSFPHTSGNFTGGTHDAFVTKFTSSGTMAYSTFIGGTSDDDAIGIAVQAGNAYIVGSTISTDFPATTTILPGGGQDAFAAKFDTNGALVYATELGGSSTESGNSIAVDSSGNAFIAGETISTNFPTVNPIQPATGGNDDGFVAKLNSGGTALVYSTYLGGSQNDTVTGIALDSSNNVYVTGITLSSNFPSTAGTADTSCGTDSTCNGGSDDAFVTEVNAAGSALVYSTFLGGSGKDDAEGIAVDPLAGTAYVTGLTQSSDFPHPGTPYQSSLSGPQDAFVTKVAAGGASFAFSTFFGGAGSDSGFGIALDSSNNVYITGETDSSTGFPLLNPITATLSGTSDAFVAELASSGSTLTFSTYFGGTGTEDQLQGAIAVDSSANIYVTGDTSSSAGFPLQTAAQGTYGGGTADAFVAKIAPGTGTGNFSITVSPGSATVTHGQTTAPFTVTVTPLNGFNTAVSLSCSGAPTGAACHFNPSSVAGGSGTSSLTISTTAASAQLSPSSQPGLFYALCLPVAGMALLGAGFAPGQSRKRKLVALLLGCLVFSGLMFLAACGGGGGGGGGGGTPPGTYNVTVKGTAGGVTNNGTPVIQLTVQ
jgi:hypothetical protein